MNIAFTDLPPSATSQQIDNAEHYVRSHLARDMSIPADQIDVHCRHLETYAPDGSTRPVLRIWATPADTPAQLPLQAPPTS